MNKKYIPFPEEYDRRKLNSLYREIPLKDNTSRTLRKYFNAMANLYGIVPLKKAWEIIHDQCPRMITEAEFWAFAKIARHENEKYLILGIDDLCNDVDESDPFEREIIDFGLFETGENLYPITKQQQKGKPYYIPSKQELLLYANPYYRKPTPEMDRLLEFCETKLEMNVNSIAIFECMLQEAIRYSDFNASPLDFRDYDISFSSEKQFNQFAQLYQDAFNHGQMQCNRGFSPLEIREMTPPEERAPKSITFGPNIRRSLANGTIKADEMRAQIFSMDLPSEEIRLDMLRQLAGIEKEAGNRQQKVPRNAPCPCGSGRKYKNCCGRN